MKTRAFDLIENRWREDYIVSPAGSIFQTTLYKMDLWELEARPNWKLSRFPGIVDKDGNDIFEHCIIDDTIRRYVVAYDPDTFEFYLKHLKKANRRALMKNMSEHYTIIGNVFENPELLEVE